MKSIGLRLGRNIKPGQYIRISSNLDDLRRSQYVRILGVNETRRGHITRKRMWILSGDYPFWFGNVVTSYSDDKFEVFTE